MPLKKSNEQTWFSIDSSWSDAANANNIAEKNGATIKGAISGRTKLSLGGLAIILNS